MIEDFKAKRLHYRAPATVAKEIQVLKRLFRKAVEWGRITASPATAVTKPRTNNGRVRFLEPDEMDRLMEALPAWQRPFAEFARFTGARRGEIFNLTWQNVDFKRRQITFRGTKAGEDQRIKMNQTTHNLLSALPEPISRSQRVFPDTAPMKFRRAWERACRKARIGIACECYKATEDQKPDRRCGRCEGTGIVPDFHFHDLRHQAATDLLTMGATLNDVRDFLRHKSMNMTLRYAHLVEDRREQTACLLDGIGRAQKRAQSDRPTV
jgi:integrase